MCPAGSALLSAPPGLQQQAMDTKIRRSNIFLPLQSLPFKKLEATCPNPIPQRCLFCLFLLSCACEEETRYHCITCIPMSPLLPQLQPRSKRCHAPYCTKVALFCNAFVCCHLLGLLLLLQTYSCFLLHLKTSNCRACISRHRHASSPV